MAIGIVSCPLRDRKLVAPNSPSEIAAARPAADDERAAQVRKHDCPPRAER